MSAQCTWQFDYPMRRFCESPGNRTFYTGLTGFPLHPDSSTRNGTLHHMPSLCPCYGRALGSDAHFTIQGMPLLLPLLRHSPCRIKRTAYRQLSRRPSMCEEISTVDALWRNPCLTESPLYERQRRGHLLWFSVVEPPRPISQESGLHEKHC